MYSRKLDAFGTMQAKYSRKLDAFGTMQVMYSCKLDAFGTMQAKYSRKLDTFGTMQTEYSRKVDAFGTMQQSIVANLTRLMDAAMYSGPRATLILWQAYFWIEFYRDSLILNNVY